MPTTTSKDGTNISYDRIGEGMPVVLVDGAFGSRGFGPMPKLATRLANRFTVYTYDRRGRGESGAATPCDPSREVEDLHALIEAAGGSVFLYGFSSGAILAFRAAARLAPAVTKLALYEPPLAAADGRSPLPERYQERLAELVAAGRRTEAVSLFLKEAVGMAEAAVVAMQSSSAWKGMEAAVDSLPNDIAIQVEAGSGRPLPARFVEPLSRFALRPLILRGDKSPAWLGRAAEAIAAALPGSRLVTLPEQTHDVRSEALAPHLLEYFGA